MGINFAELEADYIKSDNCALSKIKGRKKYKSNVNEDIEWSTSLEANVTCRQDFDLYGFYHYEVSRSDFTKVATTCRVCISNKATRTYFSFNAFSPMTYSIARYVWKLFHRANLEQRFISYKLVCCFQCQEDCFLYFVFYFSDLNTEQNFLEFMRRKVAHFYDECVVNLFGHTSEIRTMSFIFLPLFEAD